MSATTSQSPAIQGVSMPASNIGAETSAQGAASSYAAPKAEMPPARRGSVPESVASDAGTHVSLPHAVVAQLEKAEAKDAKKVTKILQKEGKTSDKELAAAIKDFDSLEKQHKKAAKNESKAQSASTKAAKKAHKLELAFLKAKGKFEQAHADISAQDALHETAKTQAAAVHKKLQSSTTALEQLRQQKAAGDRERSAKLEVLKAQSGSESGMLCGRG